MSVKTAHWPLSPEFLNEAANDLAEARVGLVNALANDADPAGFLIALDLIEAVRWGIKDAAEEASRILAETPKKTRQRKAVASA